MTNAINLEEVFRRAGVVEHLFAELEWNDWVLGAMDDEHRSRDLLQIGFRVELSVDEEA